MYQIGSLVEMKKPHACTIKATGKKANEWEVTRLGADIKIRCTNCDHVVMMSRHDFEKKLKKNLVTAAQVVVADEPHYQEMQQGPNQTNF